MVDTKKFSEFADGGDLTKDNTTVGLSGGANTFFNNPWPFLPPGSTGDRPAIEPSMYFRMRFNTTTELYEYYSSTTSSWITVDAGADILPLLASHAAGEGASLIGLEDQGTIISKTVQDLANASLISKTNNGTLVNGQFLDSLPNGMLSVTTGTGVLNSRIQTGTANQIDIANGDGSANPTYSLSGTLDLPGTMTIQSSTVIDSIIDDDSMATATDTNVPTSESVVAYVSSVAGSYLPLAGGTMSGNIAMGTNSITGMADPINAQDAATKAYVDSRTDLYYMEAVLAASTGNFTSTYDNGTAGVGATLTASSNGAFSLDGEAGVLNARYLMKDQTATEENGIYTLTQVGDASNPAILTRATDFDTPSEIDPGDIVPVLNGTVNGSTAWIQTATVNTIGTDAITFSQWTAAFSNVVTLDSTQTITGDKTFTGTTIFDNLQISGNSISSNSGAVTIDPTSGQAFTVNVIGGAGIDFNFTGAGDFDVNLGSGLFVLDGTTGVDSVLDEDNMASDSATALATQQSIKAYVDSQVGASGGLQSVQVFTSGGTWTKPAGINKVIVEVLGAGGGGGYVNAGTSGAGCGAGGGAGAYAKDFIDVTGTSSETVTVGAGGSGGVGSTSTAATAGGTSSFGAFISCTGGSGGSGMTRTTGSSSAIGGSGGTSSGALFATSGANADVCRVVSGLFYEFSSGADSVYGGGAQQNNTDSNGAAATGFGAGGGGGTSTTTSRNGGAGSGGLVIVWEFS